MSFDLSNYIILNLKVPQDNLVNTTLYLNNLQKNVYGTGYYFCLFYLLEQSELKIKWKRKRQVFQGNPTNITLPQTYNEILTGNNRIK